MNNLQSITIHTNDGDFHIIIDVQAVARLSGFGSIDALMLRLPKELQAKEVEPIYGHPYESLVNEYYNGDPSALDKIPHFQSGSEFQKEVWSAISNVPYRKTISYKELAASAGRYKAIRAAGTICGLNKLILLVPCHRILKSDGGIGSYLYGPEIKESLLRGEDAL